MNKQASLQKILHLYSGLGWRSLFAKIRFWDAPLVELESLAPKEGTIADLGCGEGLLANFLALASPKREILGMDKDEERVKYATQGLPNTKFILGDIVKDQVPEADAILLVHVLHHLDSFRDQEALLRKCRSKLRPGGLLIIVEVEPKPTFKFLVAWLTDHFLVPWIFEKRFYSPIFFKKTDEWLKVLKSLDFHCETIPAEKGKPFTHVIFSCRKIS